MRTFGNLLAFSPELWLLGGAIVVFVLARFTSGAATTSVALITIVLAFFALATQFKQTLTILDGAFVLDGYAIVVDVVVLAATALVLLAGSADILPEIREYERTSTAVVNAYVGPAVSHYMRSLTTKLVAAGITAPLEIMQSAGG